MNGLPYYKAYPRDFIEGTIGMSFELKGAYRLVLDLIYMQGGNLPDDARYISGLLGCSVRQWNAFRRDLVAIDKLQVSGDFLTNYRAVSELETSAKLQNKNRENASKSNKNKTLGKATAPLTRDYTEPDTEEEKKEPSGSFQKKMPKRGERIGDFEPDLNEAAKLGLSPSQAKTERDKFRDFWISKPGAGGVKLDWPATWRNWCRTATERQPGQRQSRPPPREDGFDKAIREELERANGHGQQFDDFRHSIEIEPDRDHSSAVFARVIAASGGGH